MKLRNYLVIPLLLVICVIAFAIYSGYVDTYPDRGYTLLGIVLGTIAIAVLLLVYAYSLRKRAAQEKLSGQLSVWLWFHIFLSIVAVFFVTIHSGFNLDGGSGTWTTVLLVATLVSGLFVWVAYRRIPRKVYEVTGNLSAGATRKQRDALVLERDDFLAGLTDRDRDALSSIIDRGDLATEADLDSATVEQARQLYDRKRGLEERLRKQEALHKRLRRWLWVHVPSSILLVGVLVYHVYDGLEVRFMVANAFPAIVEVSAKDFADPLECAECHPVQYNDWIGSMHAIAQLSPVTDLQTRLVLHKEYVDFRDGGVEPFIGELCEDCHAPLGSKVERTEHQYPLIDPLDREPASMFGVSCATCHQVTMVHPDPNAGVADPKDKDLCYKDGVPYKNDNDDDNLCYKNIENLDWQAGKVYFGPLPTRNPDRMAVGNDYHSGESRDYFSGAEFCASCHTVVVDNPETGKRVVKLQDTYMEWVGKETYALNWQKDPQVRCIGCHGAELGEVVNEVRKWQEQRKPLAERRQDIRLLMSNLVRNRRQDFAALPPDGFDLPLERSPQFRHSFVGVDYHLEPDLPYPADHPMSGQNPAIQETTVRRVADLMAIAAAIRIDGRPRTNDLKLSVMNLATGHNLPAGFAFAREMWVEVSASSRRNGDDWTVLVGGREGRELRPSERLDKKDSRLRNFQAVLFNGATGRETVLQNEATNVLKGNKAVAKGFIDRQAGLLPGEIRPLSISLPRDWAKNGRTQRLRVRLLFRNYPPEFIEELGDRFRELDDTDFELMCAAESGRSKQRCIDNQRERAADLADRAFRLIGGLRIFEMAEDVITL